MSGYSTTTGLAAKVISDSPISISYSGLGAGEQPTLTITVQLDRNRVDEFELERALNALYRAVKK